MLVVNVQKTTTLVENVQKNDDACRECTKNDDARRESTEKRMLFESEKKGRCSSGMYKKRRIVVENVKENFQNKDDTRIE